MDDTLITIVAFVILALAVNQMTKRSDLLRDSRREAYRKLINTYDASGSPAAHNQNSNHSTKDNK